MQIVDVKMIIALATVTTVVAITIVNVVVMERPVRKTK